MGNKEVVTIIENNGEIFEVATIEDIPDNFIISTVGDVDQVDENTIIESTFEAEEDKKNIFEQGTDVDNVSGVMDDKTLKSTVSQLLRILAGEDFMKEFGWPNESIEHVLSSIIEHYAQVPVDSNSCADYASEIRENVKILLTNIIDNEALKSMLNNHPIDEVINNILSDKSFANLLSGRKQTLQVNNNSKEESSECKICNRKFIRKDGLARHMRQKHK